MSKRGAKKTPKSGPKRDSSKPSAAEARAAAEANREAKRGEREAALEAHFGGEVPGKGLLAGAVWPTAMFVVITVITTVVQGYMYWVSAIFDVAMFVVGTALFLLAIYSGSQRSRLFDMTMSGWFFLVGAAPKAVKTQLLGSLAVQVAVSFIAASIRPFTALAFAILVPIYGVATTAVWSAKFGYFPPRQTGDPLLGNND